MALAMPKLARAGRREVGVAEHLVRSVVLLAWPLDGVEAVHELGEVELELVPVARRVRALHLAQLALEAGVHDARLVGRGACARRRRACSSSSSNRLGKLSQYLKHMRQPWQTSKTRVTSLSSAGLVPVLGLARVVGEAVGGLVGDVLVVGVAGGAPSGLVCA
jgi:hypothetical protein